MVYRIGEAVGAGAAAYHIDIVLGSPNVKISSAIPAMVGYLRASVRIRFLTASLRRRMWAGRTDQGAALT